MCSHSFVGLIVISIHIWVTTNVDKVLLGIGGKRLVTKLALTSLSVRKFSHWFDIMKKSCLLQLGYLVVI